MKKIYTILAAAASFAASAQSPALDFLNLSGEQTQLATWLKGTAPSVPPTVNTGSSVDPDNWTEDGQGAFRDDIMRSAFELPYVEFYARIQSSTHTPGLYRMPNPYGQYPISAGDLHNNNNMDDWNFLILHAEDPGHVWMEDFSTGLYVDGLGYITVRSQAASLIANYGFDQVVASAPEVFGKLSDGIVTFPARCTVDGESYATFVVSVDEMPGRYVAVNTDGLLTYAMPGVMMPPLPESAVRLGFINRGPGKFTDGILATRASVTPAETDVEVYENMAMPGYYMVKGAWQQVGVNSLLQIDARDPEYVLIPSQDTGFDDPAEGGTFIVSHSYEELYLAMYPTYKEQFLQQFPAEVITFDRATGKIDIPAGSVRYQWIASTDPTTMPHVWYTSRKQLPSKLTFNPELVSVVESVATDIDAAPEYHTLQGLRVANPAPGQILIRRCGGKTEKIRF